MSIDEGSTITSFNVTKLAYFVIVKNNTSSTYHVKKSSACQDDTTRDIIVEFLPSDVLISSAASPLKLPQAPQTLSVRSLFMDNTTPSVTE